MKISDNVGEKETKRKKRKNRKKEGFKKVSIN